MKTKRLITLLAGFGALTFAAVAQDGGGPPDGGGQGGGPGRGHRHPPIPAIVLALDANHDGIIDSNEIANASAVLKTLDKNGDGQLTRDEYMGKPPGRPSQGGNGGNDAGGPPPDENSAGGPPDGASTNSPAGGSHGRHHPPLPAIVLALDANQDGVIDADEIANASAALKTLDKNGDGQLTRDEYMGKPPGRPVRGGNMDSNAGGPPPEEGNGPGGPPNGPPPQQ